MDYISEVVHEEVKFYILDQNFQTQALLNSFESLLWVERYDSPGDFEVYTYPTPEIIKYAVKNNYIWKSDSEHMMIIEELELISDPESGTNFIIRGRSLESILDRRVIWTQTRVTGGIQVCIKRLIVEAIISPLISSRKISNFVFQDSTDSHIVNTKIDKQFTGDSLLEAVMEICQDNGIGFKIVLNSNNQFVFSLYNGTDRSYSQETNPYIVFSPKFANLMNSNYFESNQEYKNVVLVAGEGEETNRVTRTIGSISGITRRELYVDARDISSEIKYDSDDEKNLISLNFTRQIISGVTFYNGNKGRLIIDGKPTVRNYSTNFQIAQLSGLERGKYRLKGSVDPGNDPYRYRFTVLTPSGPISTTNGEEVEFVININNWTGTVYFYMDSVDRKDMRLRNGDDYEWESGDVITISVIGTNIMNPSSPNNCAEGEYTATITSAKGITINVRDADNSRVYPVQVQIKKGALSLINTTDVPILDLTNISISRLLAVDELPVINNKAFTPHLEMYAMHDLDYYAALDKRGYEKLSASDTLEYFEGEIDTDRLYFYKKDFFMGDLVQVANEFDMVGKARIMEFISSYSTDGIKQYPTFKIIQEED